MGPMDDTSVEVCDYADGQEWQKNRFKEKQKKADTDGVFCRG